ncbi:hypothetical protein CRG98_047056 [Punica granatum]|uniref:Uncharacterized protein n=1 Tax=Punica granatum TaxID=22663 RepID=A0A2I0HLJ0_PUNGR|nr:hypothetical protein CRG98_047056 [Punica granatum]
MPRPSLQLPPDGKIYGFHWVLGTCDIIEVSGRFRFHDSTGPIKKIERESGSGLPISTLVTGDLGGGSESPIGCPDPKSTGDSDSEIPYVGVPCRFGVGVAANRQPRHLHRGHRRPLWASMTPVEGSGAANSTPLPFRFFLLD